MCGLRFWRIFVGRVGFLLGLVPRGSVLERHDLFELRCRNLFRVSEYEIIGHLLWVSRRAIFIIGSEHLRLVRCGVVCNILRLFDLLELWCGQFFFDCGSCLVDELRELRSWILVIKWGELMCQLRRGILSNKQRCISLSALWRWFVFCGGIDCVHDLLCWNISIECFSSELRELRSRHLSFSVR